MLPLCVYVGFVLNHLIKDTLFSRSCDTMDVVTRLIRRQSRDIQHTFLVLLQQRVFLRKR